METVNATPRSDESKWGVSQLNLDAYLTRIGFEGRPKPTTETLFALHRAHVMAIPFENLGPLLGRTPSLELRDIVDKLVGRPRGGYCYEHNLLFAAVLERVGYRVDRLVGRIRGGTDRVHPRTHMMLRVEVPGESGVGGYLADVGIGNHRPLDPLPFTDGAVADQGGWEHALAAEEGGTWVLRHRSGAEDWDDLYGFTLEPQHLADYKMANHFSSTYPNSPFLSGLFIARTGAQRRLSLRGWQLTEHTAAGSETRTVEPGELRMLLAERFGIALPDEDLDELISRLCFDERSAG